MSSLATPHGDIEFPAFLPDGTVGVVRAWTARLGAVFGVGVDGQHAALGTHPAVRRWRDSAVSTGS